MRKVFFSFHYARDCWSVSQIRNSWLASPYHDAQPFFDRAAWEQVKRRGDAAIKAWIDSQMRGTSVTIVLIGPQTLGRKWVRHEIDQSLALGKGLLGVTMENMRQANQALDSWSQYTSYGPLKGADGTHPVYSWTVNDGRKNLTHWIEDAMTKAVRAPLTRRWI